MMPSSASVKPSVPQLGTFKGLTSPPGGDSHVQGGADVTDDRAVRGQRTAFDACLQAAAGDSQDQHSRSRPESASASPRVAQGMLAACSYMTTRNRLCVLIPIYIRFHCTAESYTLMLKLQRL